MHDRSHCLSTQTVPSTSVFRTHKSPAPTLRTVPMWSDTCPGPVNPALCPGAGFITIKQIWKHLQTFDKFGNQMNKKQRKFIHMLLYCYCELWDSKISYFFKSQKCINHISYCPNSTFRYTSDATDLGRYGFVLLWSETSSLLLIRPPYPGVR